MDGLLPKLTLKKQLIILIFERSKLRVNFDLSLQHKMFAFVQLKTTALYHMHKSEELNLSGYFMARIWLFPCHSGPLEVQ